VRDLGPFVARTLLDQIGDATGSELLQLAEDHVQRNTKTEEKE
jgi:hypothetical protein